MRQKRKAPRKQCIARIRLTWEFQGRGGYHGSALLDDKSSGGLGIHCPSPIPIGAAVVISQGSATSKALVRHCTKVQRGFLIGVEFCNAAMETAKQETSLETLNSGV